MRVRGKKQEPGMEGSAGYAFDVYLMDDEGVTKKHLLWSLAKEKRKPEPGELVQRLETLILPPKRHIQYQNEADELKTVPDMCTEELVESEVHDVSL